MLLAMSGDAPETLSPPIGFRWVVKSAYLLLTSGTAVGTRNASMSRQPINPTGLPPAYFCATGNQTGVSTSYTAILQQTNGTGGTVQTQQTAELVIAPSVETIAVGAQLLAGDALLWLVVVDEVPA